MADIKRTWFDVEVIEWMWNMSFCNTSVAFCCLDRVYYETIEDTKGVRGSRKSKNRQYKDQNKRKQTVIYKTLQGKLQIYVVIYANDRIIKRNANNELYYQF